MVLEQVVEFEARHPADDLFVVVALVEQPVGGRNCDLALVDLLDELARELIFLDEPGFVDDFQARPLPVPDTEFAEQEILDGGT